MVNAGELFAGAAVGGAFGPVFDVFREVVEKTFEFNPTLKSVKSTVDSLELLIPQIEGHNNALGGNREGEVEKLKETMEEGKKLIEELLEVNEWSWLKARYTEQLVGLDESLKRHLGILQVQGAIDGKEALVVAKDTKKDVEESLALTKEHTRFLKDISVTAEGNTNQLDRFESALYARLSDLRKGQDAMIATMTYRVKRHRMEDKVGSLMEAAALGASLEQLYDVVSTRMDEEIKRRHLGRIFAGTSKIFELIEWKWAKNKEMSYIPTEQLKNFRVEIEEGVELVQNCTKVLEWTDDLKSEYTNKFLHLEKTLERLYNRLNGIHPFKWNAGKCGSSCGTASMRDSDIINDRFSHSDHV